MQIQVNTGENIAMDAGLKARLEAQAREVLDRFGDQLTRLEIHFSDEVGARDTGNDKRCALEARPASHRPVGTSHNGATLEEAANGALRKMQRRLDTVLGRRSDVKGGDTIRGQ